MTDQQQQRPSGAPDREGAPPSDAARGNAQVAVRIAGPVTDLDQAWRLASNLSLSRLLPEKLLGKPPDVFAILLYGQDLGLSPMQAIQGINVVEGRPSLGAATWSGLMNTHGHKTYVPCRHALTTGRVCNRPAGHPIHDPDNPEKLAHDYEADHDDTRCRLRCVRADGEMFESVWDVDRAVAANLLFRRPVKGPDGEPTGEFELVARSQNGKPLPWELHRKSMFYARCMSEVCRQAAPQIAMGFYSADEAEEIAARERAERAEAIRLDVQPPGPEEGLLTDEERLAAEVADLAGMEGVGLASGLPNRGPRPEPPTVEEKSSRTVESAGHRIRLIGGEDIGFVWACDTCFPDDRDMDESVDEQARMPLEDALADHAHYASTLEPNGPEDGPQ